MSKAHLIHLIVNWRGRREMITPANELRHWSLEELQNAWRELREAGR
jgi:hypothetical protein